MLFFYHWDKAAAPGLPCGVVKLKWSHCVKRFPWKRPSFKLWYHFCQVLAARAAKNVTFTPNLDVYSFLFSRILFPTPGSAEASGNAGLWDQLAALRWVQQSISSFGGDPGRVSLGAERGGADVTSVHLLTGTGTDLFRRLLLMVSSIPASAAPAW